MRKPSLLPGTIVADSYRLGALLGAGGMGEVYEAEHVERAIPVALKLLREEASDALMERFGREGRALSQMHGQHLLKVFDVGVLKTGRPFIIMERLHGSDLAVMLAQRGRLPLARAVKHVLEACVGLAEAHGLGIVHRDIKPANLFRCDTPSGPSFIKVLDFGISKVNAAARAGKTGLTEAGDVFGSPKYMSPEQLRATRDVDTGTDIWSLGITLAELTTGTTPFEADDYGALIFNILDGKPPSVAHVDPTHGARFDAIVRRCLASNSNARYESVAALADALAPLIDDGRAQAARVRAELNKAIERAPQLQMRARPQVTRVLEAAGETSVMVHMTLAPLSRTLDAVTNVIAHPHRSSAINDANGARGSNTINDANGARGSNTINDAKAVEHPGASPQWGEQTRASVTSSMRILFGAAAVLAVGGIAVGVVLNGDSETDNAAARTSDSKTDTPKTKKRKKKKIEQPSTAGSTRRVLPPEVAQQRTFRIAPEIVTLLPTPPGRTVQVRELLFFSGRAALIVQGTDGLVRYDYQRGQLSEPRPVATVSGAQRDQRIPLGQLELHRIVAIAAQAERTFGAAKLHSIGLQWLENELQWVASSKDGKQLRFAMNGTRR